MSVFDGDGLLRPSVLGGQFDGDISSGRPTIRTPLFHGSTHSFGVGDMITPQSRAVVPWKTSISDKHGALAWATKDPNYAITRATHMSLKQQTVTGELRVPRLFTVEHAGTPEELENIQETKGQPWHYTSTRGFRVTGELAIPNYMEAALHGLRKNNLAVANGKFVPLSEEPHVCPDCGAEMPGSQASTHFAEELTKNKAIMTPEELREAPQHRPQPKYFGNLR